MARRGCQRIGQFVSGALALAISPVDVNHLLLGTDSALLHSHNGGRDWALEAPSVLVGAVFAVAFAADGQRALVSTGLGIFRSETENGWRQLPAPPGATPARAIVRGAEAGRVYVAGPTGFFLSDDWGLSWSSAADGLPDGATTTLLAVTEPPETLYAVVEGRIWASVDGARTWARRDAGLSTVSVEALAMDSTPSAQLWAVGADRLFRSNDRGLSWKPHRGPLPEPNTTVRGIIATEESVVVTTDRDGHVSEFHLPRAAARPFGVAVDAANNVWYSDLGGWVGMLPAVRATAP